MVRRNSVTTAALGWVRSRGRRRVLLRVVITAARRGVDSAITPWLDPLKESSLHQARSGSGLGALSVVRDVFDVTAGPALVFWTLHSAGFHRQGNRIWSRGCDECLPVNRAEFLGTRWGPHAMLVQPAGRCTASPVYERV